MMEREKESYYIDKREKEIEREKRKRERYKTTKVSNAMGAEAIHRSNIGQKQIHWVISFK